MDERIKIKFKPKPIIKKKGLNGFNAFFLIVNLILLSVNIYYICFIKPEFLFNSSQLGNYPAHTSIDTSHQQAKKILKDSTTIEEIKEPESISKPLVKYVHHIVQKEQTLYSISRQYKISMDTIRKTNSIRNNLIVVGQTLKIPQKNENNNSNGLQSQY
nr:LysM peptidoglycan-binding domain-containing protein [uncultured Draconibacterium sp.]